MPDIYKEAFNSAWDQYKDKEDRRDDASREETAHKVGLGCCGSMNMPKGMMINGIKNRKTGSLVKAIRAVLPCKWSADCILSR